VPIGQDHVSNGALIFVVTVGLDGDVLPEGEVRDGVLGIVAIGLALFRAVDPAVADVFGLLVVQNLDRVAVEDGDGGAGGSHPLKRQGAHFVIETEVISFCFVSFFTVISVGK
jgi:hypothetical protein